MAVAGGVVPVLRVPVPIRASEFMQDIVEPRGLVAVLVTLVVVALAAVVTLGALRLHRFTLIRDGDVLRQLEACWVSKRRPIPISRIQAVRIVKGYATVVLGYCSLHVKVPPESGKQIQNQRMLPLVLRIDRAESLIRRSLPELPWPSLPLLTLPGPCPPPLSHRCRSNMPHGFHPADAVPAWVVETGGSSSAAAGLRAQAVARAREARWQVNARPWSCGGGDSCNRNTRNRASTADHN